MIKQLNSHETPPGKITAPFMAGAFRVYEKRFASARHRLYHDLQVFFRLFHSADPARQLPIDLRVHGYCAVVCAIYLLWLRQFGVPQHFAPLAFGAVEFLGVNKG
jgi:hypothetical protein